MKKTLLFTLACISFSVSASASVPQFTRCLTWEPQWAHFLLTPLNCFYSYVSAIRSYNRDDYSDAGCSIAALRAALIQGAGIIAVDSHAYSGGVVLGENSSSADSRDRRLIELRGIYTQIADDLMPAEWEEMGNPPTPQYFGIVISASRTNSWAKGASQEPQGLVYNCVCNSGGSARIAYNTAACVGYDPTVTYTEAMHDISEIFGRMNGSIDSGKNRTANLAVSSAQGIAASIFPSDSTIELCPVVVDTYPYYDPKKYARRTYTGWIQFSSPMDDDTLSQVICGPGVSWQVGGDPSWDDSTNTKINFAYSITGGAGTYTITVKGSARAKISDQTNSLYLDGNRISPNQDDYAINFRVTECGP